jgi:hypothetical protein
MSEPPDGIPSGQDELDRRLREITSGLAGEARFKEPSAAERARKPVQPAEVKRKRLGWRAARKARKLREPVTGPGQPAPKYWRVTADRGAPGGQRRAAPKPVPQRARRRRSLARQAAIALAFGGLLYGLHALGFGPQAPSSPQNPNTPTPRTAGSGSPSPRHVSVPAFTIADPFAGSPAANFLDGTAGIVLPAAHPVGGYSATQVAAAYAVTRKMLIAAYLDPGTLHGGRPVAFARLLTARERSDFTAGLDLAGVSDGGHPRNARGWVTSFAPGTQLVGSVIAVHGVMSALTARQSGRAVLRVHADYLFVYPVQRPGLPLTRMRIVTRVAVNVDFAQWSDPGGPLQPWWQLVGGGPHGIRCGINDGFVHPQFPGGQPGPVQPSGIPIDPYDQRIPPSHAGCVAITRT